MLSITDQEAAICAATIELAGLAPYFAARFAAARRLLLRGGWTQTGKTVLFPGGAATTGQHCTCQEGLGPVVCLHQIASRILDIAERARALPRQGAEWPRAGWIVVARTASGEFRRCAAQEAAA